MTFEGGAGAADLARLPDLLAITRPDSIDEPEPDEAGLHRLLSAAAVSRRRGRRRVLAGLAAAAAAVVLLGGGMIGWRASQSDAGQPVAGPTAPVQFSAGPSTQGVSAAVTLTPAAWGAELAMMVTGVPPQTKCTLVVVTNDGTTVTALERVSFQVPHGGFLSLLGPSGCGKSTLLSLVAGLDRPTSGRYLLDGVDVAGPSPTISKTVSVSLAPSQ